MMAHPFMPMTNEMIKKLTRVNQDLNSAIKSCEYPAEFASQNPNSTIESNPQCSESNQSNLRTNNRY